MWIDKAYKKAKSTLAGWKVEKDSFGVTATYIEGIDSAYYVTARISLNMYNEYTVKLTCRFANRLSASCVKVAYTDSELEVILDDIKIGVLYHLFDGLEEKLNEAMKEYMSEFERLL